MSDRSHVTQAVDEELAKQPTHSAFAVTSSTNNRTHAPVGGTNRGEDIAFAVTSAANNRTHAPPVGGTNRGEDIAFAVTSAGMFMLANELLPVAGGLAVAAVIPELNRLRQQRYARPAEPIKPHIREAVDYTCAVRHFPHSSEWNAWLPWGDLCAGEKVPVPAELPHPKNVGFKFTRLASDVGQSADWVYSLADGSRLHAHEYPDGRIVVHRDELDPSQGPVTATFHWMSETREGNMLALGLTCSTLFLIWRLADRGEIPA